jgi:hypothetical protein
MSHSISLARWRFLLIPAVLAACSDSTDNGGGGNADAALRTVHASPAIGPIDVLVDDTPIITGLAYGESSPEVAIEAGQRHFVIRSGATVLGDMQHTATDTYVNSLVIADGVPQFSEVVVPDTGQPAPSKANLRLVNVVGSNLSAPTALLVRIKAPNANPDSVVTSNLDATVAAYWSLMYFDPGQFDIRYVAANDTATTLASASFTITAGEKKAAVLSRADNGTYSVNVVLEP